MDPQSLRHLDALRSFVRNLVEQAEKAGGCECHRPPSLLLVGPPGAGKTYLVKQMSSVCDMPLFGVHSHHLSGAFTLRNLFSQARAIDYPSLFFLDDIDVIFANQNDDVIESPLAHGLRTELFAQLGPRKLKIFDQNAGKNPVEHELVIPGAPPDEVLSVKGEAMGSPKRRGAGAGTATGPEVDPQFPDNNGLILVAATSSPWLMYKDHELLSRFRGVYLVGLPDRETRFNILKSLLQKIQHNLTEKDIWVVADKTDGFTPSDLMIVVKALNYKQFEFLFTLAGSHGSEGSSDDGSLSSSELTESETESDEDELEGLNSKNLMLIAAQERMAMMTPIPGHSSLVKSNPPHCVPPSPEGRQTPVPNAPMLPAAVDRSKPPKPPRKLAPSMAVVYADWGAEAGESRLLESNESASPTAESKNPEPLIEIDPISNRLESDSPSPDSALGLSKSSEEDIDGPGPGPDPGPGRGRMSPLNDLEESGDDVTNLFCDSNISAIDSSVLSSQSVDNKMVDRSVEEVDVEVEVREFVDTKDTPDCEDPLVNKSAAKEKGVVKSDAGEDVREFRLNLHGPPDPVRDDNLALDSDRDSDCENVNAHTSPRNRRVNFSGMTTMEPLTVDVDTLDSGIVSGMGPLDSGIVSGMGALDSGIVSGMGPLDPEGESGMRLLNSGRASGMGLLASGRESGMGPFPSRRSPLPTNDLSVDETDRAGVSSNLILRSLLSRSASVSYRGDNLPISDLLRRNKRDDNHDIRDDNRNIRDENRDCSLGSQGNTDLGLSDDGRRRSCPDLERSLFNYDDESIALKALLGASLKTDKSSTPEATGSISTRTTPSVTPTPSVTSCRSVASSGSGTRVTVASSESDNAKKQDSASSDISTATCNETGETLECQSDADERFRNLAEDLSEPRARAPLPPPGDEDDDDEEAFEKKKLAIHGLLNLDELGEISIQIITLADVLEVVSKTPRSVSEEEIKRYTEFMIWFAKVAKSACPHAPHASKNKNEALGRSHFDDVSLASTMSVSTQSKKRRKPLRKVGHFLLKALMFILD